MASQRRRARVPRHNSQKPVKQLVHFKLKNPSARKVCVAGTFNNWEANAGKMARQDDGTWAKALTLKPGTYEYRLVVDGKWMPDPQADHSVLNRFGERNSLLTVP